MAEPQRPKNMPSRKRRLAWAHELIKYAERYGALEKYLKESKKPKPYSSYVACLCDIMGANHPIMKMLHKRGYGRIPWGRNINP
jgi:hypothetical protein